MTFKILRLPEVKKMCGISRSTIYQGMKDETFPQSIQLGVRMVGWSQSEIESWIDRKITQAQKRRVA